MFQPFLGDLDSWDRWLVALRALYGLPFPQESRRADRELIRETMGRSKIPTDGFDTALFLTGRRSGKSRTAAVIGAYEAVLAGHDKKLSKGEKGIVLVCSPTKSQSRIVRDYTQAIFETPILANEVKDVSKEGFELKNGIKIEILAGDWRTIRGFTLVAAIVDEAAFFGYDSESKVRSDTELMRALKPSLATIGGKLIAISSPYAMKGWCYSQWKRNYGNDSGRTLVWNCPSRTMNPTLPQRIVDEALEEDLASAKAEYLGEFRDDVATFLPRDVIERTVVKGRLSLPPRDRRYVGFVDISGGRSDDGTLAIAHYENRVVIVDRVERYKPPFNPLAVVDAMAEILRTYGIRKVVGDNYSAEFVARAFDACGVRYTKSEKSKSDLYLELLPRLCSGEIELVDDPVLVSQLANLERRTRAGGRDRIDHPSGGKDDVANAVAGVAHVAASKRKGGGVQSLGAGGEVIGSGNRFSTEEARDLWSRGIHPGTGETFKILGGP